MKTFSTCLEKGAKILNLPLTPAQIILMTIHARELLHWNTKMNLTAITSAKDVAEKHFLDTLAASQFLIQAGRIMDIGSGGGFPGIPLKITCPNLDLTMVDAVRKKVSFLNHVIRAADLSGITALHARMELLAKDPQHSHRYDAVTARGFANLEKLADLALPMLTPGGSIFALKGSHGPEEVTPLLNKRFHISNTQYHLPFGNDQRFIIILKPRQAFFPNTAA